MRKHSTAAVAVAMNDEFTRAVIAANKAEVLEKREMIDAVQSALDRRARVQQACNIYRQEADEMIAASLADEADAESEFQSDMKKAMAAIRSSAAEITADTKTLKLISSKKAA